MEYDDYADDGNARFVCGTWPKDQKHPGAPFFWLFDIDVTVIRE
jgi:hypothetical protein